jgi:hypothetical protein
MKTIITDDWWKRPIVFYFGETPGNIEMLKSARDAVTVNEVEPEKLLEAATTIGLAVQACYLSPVLEKLSIWKWVASALDMSQEKCLKEGDPEGKYPLTGFFNYYLYSRDCIALSNLKKYASSLAEWASEATYIGGSDQNERILFWLVAGLIESGEISEAEKIIKKFTFKDGQILTAIYLDCIMAHEIRPLNDEEKSKAQNICVRLQSKVAPYIRQLIQEFGSTLLEYRNGEIKVIEDSEVKQV